MATCAAYVNMGAGKGGIAAAGAGPTPGARARRPARPFLAAKEQEQPAAATREFFLQMRFIRQS